MILIHQKKCISEELINLAWNSFFTSRGRGLSFDNHFPWARMADNVWSIEAVDCGNVVGGLVVREREILLDSIGVVVGCVGLVCVHPNYRNKGIANQLFERVIQHSLEKKYAALTLWTNQHHIYKSKGFSVIDRSVYGTVSFEQDESNICVYKTIDLPITIGLPPFAESGIKFVTDNSEVLVLWDAKGGIVVGWSGENSSIISLINSIFQKTFRINSRTGCSLLSALSKRKFNIEVSNSNRQMWLPLNDHVDVVELEASGYFSVLDRI